MMKENPIRVRRHFSGEKSFEQCVFPLLLAEVLKVESDKSGNQ